MDCNSSGCEKSIRHPPRCRDPSCVKVSILSGFFAPASNLAILCTEFRHWNSKKRGCRRWLLLRVQSCTGSGSAKAFNIKHFIINPAHMFLPSHIPLCNHQLQYFFIDMDIYIQRLIDPRHCQSGNVRQDPWLQLHHKTSSRCYFSVH